MLTTRPAASAPANLLLPRRLLDWVALFERLTPYESPELACHFTALDTEDRRLRFGLPVDDAFIVRYVSGLDFDRDAIFGVCSGPGEWLGVGHLAAMGKDAELGLSVLPYARGRGLGAAIFRYAVAHAARAGAEKLHMHFLTSNRAIASIARTAGMIVRSESGEADAYLEVPPYPELARMLIRQPEPA